MAAVTGVRSIPTQTLVHGNKVHPMENSDIAMTYPAVTCQPGRVASLEQAVSAQDVGVGSGDGSGKDADDDCFLLTLCCCVCLLACCEVCCGD